MATYFIQNATVETRTFRFYGVQTAHNHDTGNKFTKAIKDLMALSFPRKEVAVSPFRSGQSAIPTGSDVVQLFWKSGNWTNT